jgi:septum formation protein
MASINQVDTSNRLPCFPVYLIIGRIDCMAYELILASASPRRQQFLRDLGLSFTIVVADIDETPLPHEAPIILAERLAQAKAKAVAARLPSAGPPRLIIAADTVVALGKLQLGKPGDDAEATAMLAQLRDRVHEVHSSVSVLDPAHGRQRTRVNTTQVLMRAYTDAEIAAYVATGDPMDKAGAYAIQHRTFAPVQALTGCISGVIGLPLADLRDLLAEFGVSLPQDVVAACQPHTDFRCCQVY